VLVLKKPQGFLQVSNDSLEWVPLLFPESSVSRTMNKDIIQVGQDKDKGIPEVSLPAAMPPTTGA
jgi:hypothetical protein